MTKLLRFLSLVFVAAGLAIFTGCDKDENGNGNILDKNVEGSKLTKEFCIDLVRNHWDCNKGAVFTIDASYFESIELGCYQGDEGKIMEYINAIFDCGFMVVEESYYKNYILHLIAEHDGGSVSLGVYF